MYLMAAILPSRAERAVLANVQVLPCRSLMMIPSETLVTNRMASEEDVRRCFIGSVALGACHP